MRKSNRTRILDAAVEVVERDGVTGVTLESVAALAGVTKGGLMYHFRTREALLLAIHQHVAGEWESNLVEAAGADPDPAERLRAYARVTTQSATRAELLLLLEASITPAHAEPWADVLTRWTTPAADALRDPAALDRFIARLAADGLWMYEVLSLEPLDPALRTAVAERIAETVGGTADPGPDER